MKKQKLQPQFHIRVLNIIGSVGYIAATLQWIWLIMIFLPWLLELPYFKTMPAPQEPVTPSSPIHIPDIVTLLVMVLGVAIIVGAFYVMFVKGTRAVVKTGETITHTPAKVLEPIVIEHLHVPPKQRKTIPATLILFFKLALVFVPLILLTFSQYIHLSISFEIVMFVGIVLFAWGIGAFIVQYVLGQFFGVNFAKLR